jgi:hypothetical protein
VLVNITYGEPAVRVPLLQRLGFQVCFYVLTKSQEIAAGAAVSGVPVAGKGGIPLQGPLDAKLQVCCTHRHSTQSALVQGVGTCRQYRRLSRTSAGL